MEFITENAQAIQLIGTGIVIVFTILINIINSVIQKRFGITVLKSDEISKDVKSISTKDELRDALLMNLLHSIEKNGEMVATAFMGSKLDPATKKEVIKNWSDMEKMFNHANTLMAGLSDNLVDKAIEDIKARNELLGKVAKTAGPGAKQFLNDAIDDGTSYLEQLINKEE